MIVNVHRRTIGDRDLVAAAFDDLASENDRLWPTKNWDPLLLDRPLSVGARGGHGPIRYHCTRYQPGRLVEFTFDPKMLVQGTHTLVLSEHELRHEIRARPNSLLGALTWHLIVRWLHDALLEELLDNAQIVEGRPPATPARYSPWVRLCRAGAQAQRATRTATVTGSPSPTVQAKPSPEST